MVSHSPVSNVKITVVLAVFLGLGVFPAIAAPPPNYAIRLTADFHLQLEVTDTILPEEFPGQCMVSGTVVRLFRDRTDTLEEGQDIGFVTPCALVTSESGPSDLSDADELAGANYLEVFLNPGSSDAYALASHQYMVIKNATQDPLCQTEKAGIMC